MKTEIETYELLKPTIREQISLLDNEIKAWYEKKDAFRKEAETEKSWNKSKKLRDHEHNCWKEADTRAIRMRNLENVLGAIIAVTNKDFLDYRISVNGCHYSFVAGEGKWPSGGIKIMESKSPKKYGRCSECNNEHPLLYRAEQSTGTSYSCTFKSLVMICDKSLSIVVAKSILLPETGHYLDGV